MGKKINIFSLGKASRFWILITILTSLLIIITNIVIIDRIANIINLLYLNSLIIEKLVPFLTIISIAMFSRLFLSWLINFARFKTSSRIKLEVRNKIYSKVLEIELRYKEIKSTGALTTTTLDGVENLESFFGLFIPQIFVAILAPIGLYFYVGIFNPRIALTLIFLIPFIPISIGIVQMWVQRVAKVHWETFEDLNSFFLDSLQGLTILKMFGQIKRRKKEISDISWEFRNKTMKLLYANLTSILIMDLISMIGTALGISLAITYFFSNELSLTGAIIILLVSYEFFRPLRILGSYFHTAVNGISSGKSILKILNQKSYHLTTEYSQKLGVLDNVDIEFKDVSFTYSPNSPIILNDLNFKLEAGKITAIVGQSGTGKTTIANLIARFYDPINGDVYIGGFNLKNCNPNEIRKNISMVSQQTYLFHGSIRDNLLMAKPEATEEELLDVCEKAGISEFISSLPRKLDTSLAERAKNISGGQIQRIALARAILKNTPILILDEATSNIDSENEKIIQRTLKKLVKSKTTLIIAHRLSIVRDADKILVLDNNRIVEKGSHQELIAKKGLYRELVKDQMRYETSEIQMRYSIDELS